MNFNYLDKIWRHTFYNEVRCYPKEHNVLMTDLPEMNEKAETKMMESLFESFQVHGTYFSNPSVLASLVTEEGTSSTGLVIDSGYGMTRIIPVCESYPIVNASLKMEDNVGGRESSKPDLGGFVVTHYLSEILKERGYEMRTSAERQIVNDIKEKLCYVSTNYNRDVLKTENVKEYELPDGSLMRIGNQLFRAPEIMFRPDLVGRRKLLGLHDFIIHSIQSLDVDLRTEMYKNIILTGGNMMFPGMDRRIHSELMKFTRSEIGFSPPGTYYTDNNNNTNPIPLRFRNWIGGSILSSLSSFRNEWITKDYYVHYGHSILRRKCQRSIRFETQPEIFVSYFFNSMDEKDLKERIDFVLLESMESVDPDFKIIIGDGRDISVPFKALLLFG